MIPGRSILALSFLTVVWSCSSPGDSQPPSAASTPSAANPHAPSSPASAAQPAGALAFSAPPGWVSETPTSSLRKAQYRLPHVDSDVEDASLVVYFFGGGGGSAQANIERWAGQFEQPDGSSSSAALRSEAREVNGMKTTEVELSGTYVAETAPGSGEHVRKEDWRMLAAIVEASEGPYYVKLVGPQATVARWEANYRTFLSGMKPGS